MATRVRPDTGEAMAKQRHRLTNRSEYDGSLVHRSKLTIWFDDAKIKDNWTSAPPVGRGKAGLYSKTAIQTCLTIKTPSPRRAAVSPLAARRRGVGSGEHQERAQRGGCGSRRGDSTAPCTGQVKGDNCLRGIGQLLKEVAQRSADLAARYGGEEVAVILPDISNRRTMHLADTIRWRIERREIQHNTSAASHRGDRQSWRGTPVAGHGLARRKHRIPCRQATLSREGGRNQVLGVDQTVSPS